MCITYNPTMIQLELRVTLQKNQPTPAIAAFPFLGGVLHGVLESLVRQYVPAICQDLGITASNQLKYYAVIPPPYGWSADCTPADPFYGLPCRIVLYGHAQQHAATIAALLAYWREIRLNGRTDSVRQCQLRYLVPGFAPSAWQTPFDTTTPHSPQFTTPSLAADNATLHFYTPLKLGRLYKTAQDQWHPPGLLRIVRSLTRRLRRLEPELATALQIGSRDWVEAEEHIRQWPVLSWQLTKVHWRYGSRTKQRPFSYHGLLGQIRYAAPLPPHIITLLHWGTRLGVGESTALGQGMYVINDTNIAVKPTS